MDYRFKIPRIALDTEFDAEEESECINTDTINIMPPTQESDHPTDCDTINIIPPTQESDHPTDCDTINIIPPTQESDHPTDCDTINIIPPTQQQSEVYASLSCINFIQHSGNKHTCILLCL